jgi:hypothetical protein
MNKQLRPMQKYTNYTRFLKVRNHKSFKLKTIVNSQLCMSGCSNKVWLKKGRVPGNPAQGKRVLKKCPLSQLRFLNKDFEKLL